ncbi:MAG: hypothetical protein WA997_01485 [Anaerolineales bacterium]|nr:DUF1269 domain-containing protein [Anaerolineales bacterium]
MVIQVQWQLPEDQTEPGKQVSGLLANTIFSKSEEGLQKLIDVGLDESFVKMVNSALDPGISLILSYIHYDSLVDTQQVLGALIQFNGTLHHTTVPVELEEVILKGAGF